MYIVINDEEERYVTAKYPGLKEGLYKVSNYGNVLNTSSGYIKNILSRDQDGYIRGSFEGVNDKPIYIYLHRLVAMNFCDGYDDKTGRVWVNHLDSIRDHNYYKNLVWSTSSENNKHSFEHGVATANITHLNGELNGMCKYTDKFTHSVCRMFEDGYNIPRVMKQLGYHRCSDDTRLYDFLRYVYKRKYRRNISDQYKF